jgi:uncharacterized protein (DUF2141 family)
MKVIGIIATMIFLVSIAYAGDKLTISGEVFLKKDGDIYLCLDTAEKFSESYSSRDYLSTGCQVIKMNADRKKAGRAAFKFVNVPKGTYGIIGFQDVNGNGKLDAANLLINEPFGSYKEQKPEWSTFRWEEINFKLEEDISDVKIQM